MSQSSRESCGWMLHPSPALFNRKCMQGSDIPGTIAYISKHQWAKHFVWGRGKRLDKKSLFLQKGVILCAFTQWSVAVLSLHHSFSRIFPTPWLGLSELLEGFLMGQVPLRNSAACSFPPTPSPFPLLLFSCQPADLNILFLEKAPSLLSWPPPPTPPFQRMICSNYIFL